MSILGRIKEEGDCHREICYRAIEIDQVQERNLRNTPGSNGLGWGEGGV